MSYWGKGGNAFSTRKPAKQSVIELEGPPEPAWISEARTRAWYAAQGMPYEDDASPKTGNEESKERTSK